jgi:anti-anti-sigma factor
MKMDKYYFHKGVLSMFKYDIVHLDSKAIIFLNGDLDFDVTEIMREEIAPMLLKSQDIEIDFENVSFVDSSGIGLLITLIKDLREHGNKVVVTHLKPEVKQVFSLLQLPEILGYDVFEDFIKGRRSVMEKRQHHEGMV